MATKTTSVQEISSKAEFDAAIKAAGATQPVVLFFWETWHQPCKVLLELFTQLAADFPAAQFLTVRAEGVMDVTELFPVQSVPTFFFLKNGRQIRALTDLASPADLPKAVGQFLSPAAGAATAAAATPSAESIQDRLTKLTQQAPIMLFMKGSPDAPQCKFSRETVGILAEQGVVKYGHFDILTDPTVRAELKTFSNWPTYPQLYIDGEFAGGLDIIKELIEAGEFKDLLPPSEPADLNTRLKKLISSSRVMLFMKGSPAAPRCGFSRTIIGILASHKANYGYFDILTDDEVRQGLKVYSDWPTYPQLYIDGELAGGLDVIREMDEQGELAEALAGPAAPAPAAAE